uniref:Uncharacterized protein n=1 Tax=Oryza punctata TaxID=4537 RepID=A0A0E0MEG3_ORYPU
MDRNKNLVEKILSQSVRSLSIAQCNFELNTLTRISAPSLLASLPALSIVFIRLDDRCEDYCLHSYYRVCGDQVSCGNYCTRLYDVHDDDCVLLNATTKSKLVLQATHLVSSSDATQRPFDETCSTKQQPRRSLDSIIYLFPYGGEVSTFTNFSRGHHTHWLLVSFSFSSYNLNFSNLKHNNSIPLSTTPLSSSTQAIEHS